MKKISNNFSLVILAFFINMGFSDAQFNNPSPQLRTGKLSNGLTYYIFKNDKPKAVANFYLVQKVGSVLEEENQRGLAHFLEHMAFNGTKHFPGNSMISELEKKGIKFGTNLNAFTSFDETQYMIKDVPLTRPGITDTALLILHDWSGCITNNDKDIEEERGVIREEWRTRSSGYLRVMEHEVYPVMFAGTPYANRIPIGTIDVINNCKPQEIRDYYKKWYRPDLQGIVIVGDINVDEVEAKLKTLFADIPAPVNPAPRIYSMISGNAQPIIILGADPEMLGNNISIYWKKEFIQPAEKSTERFFKMNIIKNVISNMLNNRLYETTHNPNPPFASGFSHMTQFSVAGENRAWITTGTPNGEDFPRAIEGLLAETERVQRFGFSIDEMNRLVSGNLQLNEADHMDKNNMEDFQYIHYYVELFLRSTPILDPEWKYNETKKVFAELSIDTLNYYANKYITDKNMVVVITAQKKAILPTKEAVLAIMQKVKTMPLEHYVRSAKTKTNDMANMDPVPGKIVKTEASDFGFIQWTLSNGAKVRFKNTHYPEDRITMFGYSNGGYSLVKEEDLPSAMAVNKVDRLTRFNTGEDRITGQVEIALDKDYEWLSGSGSVKDVKSLLRQNYAKMTSFKKDQAIYDNWKKSSLESISLKAVEAKAAFRDTLTSIMRNHSTRGITLDDPEVLAKVDYDKVVSITKDRFGDASGFTFLIAGNIEEDSIRPLVEKWVGGLPSSYKNEKTVDHGMYPPTGVIKSHFTQKMKVPQTTVTIGYTGVMDLNAKNQILMTCLSGILSTIYTTEMREKEGGTYGAGVSGDITRYPKERFIFQVNFDCNPDKKDKLIDIAYREIKKISEQKPSNESLDKQKENLMKNYADGADEKNCLYWTNMAMTKLMLGVDKNDYLKTIASITPDMVQSFAKQIVSQGNIIEAVMDPQK